MTLQLSRKLRIVPTAYTWKHKPLPAHSNTHKAASQQTAEWGIVFLKCDTDVNYQYSQCLKIY